MCHDPHLRQTKRAHKGSKVLAVRISGAIRRTIRAHIVRKVVAAAVSYGAITVGELWQMLRPHSVILKAAVNKYYRIAFAKFNIRKLSAVGGNALNFTSHLHSIHRRGNIKAAKAAR